LRKGRRRIRGVAIAQPAKAARRRRGAAVAVTAKAAPAQA